MANRRMISKSISISLQVNNMSDFAQLLFTWMIPHADDWGRLPGEPAVIKALVAPMKKQTAKEVEKALAEMAQENLIVWYEVEQEKYIQIIKFDNHQSGLNKRTPSRFPSCSENFSEVLGSSEKFSPNLREENLREEKGKEEKGKTRHGKHVDLTPEELTSLEEDLGQTTTQEYIERLDGYIEQIGIKKAAAKYKSHYATIKNWYRRDTEKKSTASARASPSKSQQLIELVNSYENRGGEQH